MIDSTSHNRSFSQYRSSALALIAANAIPLFGVLLFNWDASAIVLLYWAENVILGMINVLKMITCNPDLDKIDWSKLAAPKHLADVRAEMKRTGFDLNAAVAHQGIKFFLVPFFTLHYGLFCFVHGVFVFVLFGDGFSGGGPSALVANVTRALFSGHLIWAVAALAASHLYSFFVNYLGRGEYRRTAVPLLMFQPYARIFVLHIAILFGGFFVMMLGSPLLPLVILIVGKTVLDLKLHFRERQRNAGGRESEDAPGLPENILAEIPDD